MLGWARRDLRALAVVGVSAAAVWVLTSSPSLLQRQLTARLKDGGANGQQKSMRKAVLDALDEMCHSFHKILTEATLTLLSVQQQMESKGVTISSSSSSLLSGGPNNPGTISAEELFAMLLQEGFIERLAAAEQDALKHAGIACKSEFESFFSDELFDLHSSENKEILIRTQGLSEMFSDASKGRLPLLPAVELSDELKDPTFVASVLDQIRQRKLQLFEGVLGGLDPEDLLPSTGVSTGPPPKLNALLLQASTDATLQVIESKSSASNGVPSDSFLSHFKHSVALHSRDPKFSQEKTMLDDIHSGQVVLLMKKAIDAAKAKVGLMKPARLPVLFAPDEPAISRVVSGTREFFNARAVLLLVENDQTAETERFTKEASMRTFSACHALAYTTLATYSLCNLDSFSKFTSDDLPCYVLIHNGSHFRTVKTPEEAFSFLDETQSLPNNLTLHDVLARDGQ